MKKWISVLCLLILLFSCTEGAWAEIVINEVMTDNGVFDSDGNAYDWIELWNSGNETVDLSGWGLSDRKKDLYVFTFPQGVSLKPGEYLLVYCCGSDDYENNLKRKIFYADFKLSKSGETVRLTDADGNEMQALKYPQQLGNITYGIPGGGYSE